MRSPFSRTPSQATDPTGTERPRAVDDGTRAADFPRTDQEKEMHTMADARRPAPIPEAAEFDTRDGLRTRRNVLFGLWAARRMALPAAEQEAFAWNVHFADLNEPGHDDVIRYVADALRQAGIEMAERHLRTQLREMELRAALDLDATGPGQEGRRGGSAP